MSRKADIHVPIAALPPEKIALVQSELEQVLASPVFRASKRCQILLRRITALSLAGELESLKERALGVEAFGRPPDYDTSQDPVVRATAAELRKKLAQYYMEAGRDAAVRIDLPSGSYYAEFHFAECGTVVAPLSAPLPQPEPIRSPLARWIAAALALTALAALVLAAVSWKQSDIDAFWAPTLAAPGPVLVSMGLQAAYNLRSAEAQDVVQGICKREPTAPPPALGPDELVLLRDRYVTLDDAICLARVTSLLEHNGRSYRVRAGTSTSFDDLRDTPAILIGAFDNPWTIRAAGQLRFAFVKDSFNDVGMVHDSQHPENTAWKLTNYWPQWDIPSDYAIVTRMVDAATDRPVVIAAGLTQYGTLGAGEFITCPEYFADAVQKFPSDWKKRNIQIVLNVPVVNRAAGRPRVLAVHVW